MNLSIFILFSKITVALMIVGGVYGLIHSLREIRKIRYWQYEKDIPYLFGLMVLHAFIGGACGVIISLIGGIPALVTSFITPEAIGLSMSISLLITVSGGIVVIFYRRVFYKIKNNIIKISLSLSIGLITTLFVIFLGVILHLNFILGVAVLITLGIGLSVISKDELPADSYRRPSAAEVATKDNVKNVLFLMIDDVRRRNMSIYGYHRTTTPFLESIQDKLLIFENCIANGTRSGHNIPTLLTGVYSPVHSYGSNFNLCFLPQVFEKAGYSTACISANPHITKRRYAHLFNWFCYIPYGKRYLFFVQRLIATIINRLGISYLPAHFNRADGMHMNRVAQGFIESLQDKPFFTFISYIDVHDFYLREKKHIYNFARLNNIDLSSADEKIKSMDGLALINRCECHDGKYLAKEISEVERNTMILGYDETISYTDKIIEDWFQFLEKKKILDETVIIVTSDHGEMLGEKGIWNHIDYPYNPLFEVPLFIYSPRHTGRRIKRLTGSLDIPFLVLNIAGVSIPLEFESQLMGERLGLEEILKKDSHLNGYVYICYGDADDEKLREVKETLLIKNGLKLREYKGRFSCYEYKDEYMEYTIFSAEMDGMVELYNEIQEKISLMNSRPKDLIFGSWHIEENKKPESISDKLVLKQLKSLGYL